MCSFFLFVFFITRIFALFLFELFNFLNIIYSISVITFTTFAFSTQEMKFDHTSFQTVITQYKHFLFPVFFRHFIISNLLVHFLLVKFRINYTFLAQRTGKFAIFVIFSKAYRMHGMSTLQNRQASY